MLDPNASSRDRRFRYLLKTRGIKRRHLATIFVTGNLHSLLLPCSIPVPIRRKNAGHLGGFLSGVNGRS
jgi:hypothetical protein